MTPATLLSWMRPTELKLASDLFGLSTVGTVPAPTEITHGDSENGFMLISVGPLLPDAKTTVTPRSVTAFVTTITGSFGSNWRYELPHELLTTLMPHISGWRIITSYAVTTAVVNRT